MNTRSIFRAAACAALAVFVAAPAHAQLGALRRAAQRAAAGAAGQGAATTTQTAQPASASSRVGNETVLELTEPVLDRFTRALAAAAADRAQLAQRLSTIKTQEQYGACALQYYQSPAGQAAYQKLSAASGDANAATSAANEVKAGMEKLCGPDPSARAQLQNDAQGHAQQAALAAGEFTGRQYDVIKERVVPFCRAAAQAQGEGDVRLPGSGHNIFYVYTPAEAAALRGRCAALMQALANEP